MPCYRQTDDGLLLTVRVTPNASADRIEGTQIRDDGTEMLRIKVRAVPDKGRANNAVIALLGKTLGMPKSAITLISGITSRQKTLRLDGDPLALASLVQNL